MNIELRTGSNGIHGYCTLKASDITKQDMELLTLIVEIVDKYNKEEIENA
jgi:hypothetical protein